MSAKSLRILDMTNATDDLQNPFSRATMLCEGEMNSPAGSSDAFLHS